MIGDLADNLENAESYFAIGTIPLREWFEPNALVYLATIIRQQRDHQPNTVSTQHSAFRHDRVLLFHTNADFKALQASYLDQHYARSFSAIHDRFDIGLAYLRPDEFSKLFLALKPDERRTLASYWWFAKPMKLWRTSLLRKWAKNTARPQPFAVIRKTSGDQVMLRFLKDGNSLAVETIIEPAELSACEALVKQIEAAIYKPGGKELWEHCKFSKYLCP